MMSRARLGRLVGWGYPVGGGLLWAAFLPDFRDSTQAGLVLIATVVFSGALCAWTLQNSRRLEILAGRQARAETRLVGLESQCSARPTTLEVRTLLDEAHAPIRRALRVTQRHIVETQHESHLRMLEVANRINGVEEKIERTDSAGRTRWRQAIEAIVSAVGVEASYPGAHEQRLRIDAVLPARKWIAVFDQEPRQSQHHVSDEES